jgi:hypothetical protein
MIALPPESSGARLLKFRRIKRGVSGRDREIRFSVAAGGSRCISLSEAALSGIPVKDWDVISTAIWTALLKPHEATKSYETAQLSLNKTSIDCICSSTKKGGRTGFDSSLEARAACRGWFVGLVKNRTKTNKRRSRRSRSRGLIDRDVSGATPASVGDADSRLADRRSDRAGL